MNTLLQTVIGEAAANAPQGMPFAAAVSEISRSTGHIAFIGRHEYYRYGDNVYRSPVDTPIANYGSGVTVRPGRFYCPAHLWADARDVLSSS